MILITVENGKELFEEIGLMKFKVSVCIVAYNQENYIRECLDSILNQETNFNFEVIVGDDASTDGTAKIIKEYSEKYPLQVRPILHEKNLGPTKNYFSVHNQANGMYVAHLDGDDYALPGKLQALADHLDKHDDCAIVWHRMLILNDNLQTMEGMPIVPMSHFIQSKKLYLSDLATYYGITGCHSGSMYRATAKKIYDRDEETLDYFITLSFCEQGSCAMYIEDVYGVYRCFNDNSLTRSTASGLWVAKAKLSLIRHYVKKYPELGKYFSAQCFFNFLLRSYFRYPIRKEYLKVMIECRCIPSISAFFLIGRIFMKIRSQRRRLEKCLVG